MINMGTGASNQIRSRTESATEVCSLPGNYSFKPVVSENMFIATTKDALASNQSDTATHQHHQTVNSQRMSHKSEIRSLPSPSCYNKNRQGGAESEMRSLSRRDLHQKIRDLELSLAVSESQKLDLKDRIQALEDKHSTVEEQCLPNMLNITESLPETLNAKDQIIKKLEEDLKQAQADIQIKTVKLKKRIRGLIKQTAELRQEALISRMEMKANITQHNECIESPQLNTPEYNEDKQVPHLGDAAHTSHKEIIVELSNQISEQADLIAKLKAKVSEKSNKIKQLETELKNTRKLVASVPTVSQELHETCSIIPAVKDISGRRDQHKNTINYNSKPPLDHSKHKTFTNVRSSSRFLSDSHHQLDCKSQSIALSDSDSDWDDGPFLSQVQRHSAPARSRLREQSIH